MRFYISFDAAGHVCWPVGLLVSAAAVTNPSVEATAFQGLCKVLLETVAAFTAALYNAPWVWVDGVS